MWGILIIMRFFSASLRMLYLHILHIFNDGYQASILLLLPFVAKEFGMNLTQVGVLGTVMSLLQVILAVPGGVVASKYGPYKTLISAALFYIFGFLGIALVPSFVFLIPFYILAGAGFGVFHPIAFAYVARITAKEKRGREMGNFTAIGDIGKFALSSLLTFTIVLIGWRMVSGIYAAFAFVIIVCIALILKLRKKDEAVSVADTGSKSATFKEILKHKEFLLVMATGMLDTFASASLFVFLPFLFLLRGVNAGVLGAFTGAFFIGNIVGKVILGRFVDKYKGVTIFVITEILMAISIILLAMSQQQFLLILFALILGVLTKGTVPVLQTVVSEVIDTVGSHEKYYGVYGSASAGAMTIAPLFLGIISDRFGIVAAFYSCAAAALIAIFPALVLRRKFSRHA